MDRRVSILEVESTHSKEVDIQMRSEMKLGQDEIKQALIRIEAKLDHKADKGER